MKKMQVYQLQITPPHEEEINDIITRRDYTYSHIIFEGEDLGSLDEIRRMLTEEVKLKKCSDLKNTIGFTL